MFFAAPAGEQPGEGEAMLLAGRQHLLPRLDRRPALPINDLDFESMRPLEIDLPYFLGLWCTNREKRPYHHNKHETAQKKNYGSFVMAIHGPLTPQMVVSSGFDR